MKNMIITATVPGKNQEQTIWIIDKMSVPMEINVAGPLERKQIAMVMREMYVGLIVSEESDDVLLNDGYRVTDNRPFLIPPENVLTVIDLNAVPRKQNREVWDYIQQQKTTTIEFPLSTNNHPLS